MNDSAVEPAGHPVWRRAEALAGRRPPTWLLGFVVAVLAWGPGFALPSPGLDPSWWSGLYMATDQGLDFGTEVVFTYGPLGFMNLPWLWDSGLAAIAFAYAATVYVAFAMALVWTFRGRLGAPLACLIAFLVLAGVPGIIVPIGLAVLWAFAVLSKQPPRHSLVALATGGAVFAAVECLGKLSTGPVVLVVLLLALIGARAPLKLVSAFIAIFVFSIAALWLGTGQSLSGLPEVAGNWMGIVSGYNEAMASPTSSIPYAVAMVLAVCLSLVWAASGDFPSGRARYASVAVALIVGFAMYKQGVVRSDTAHLAIAFGTMAVVWAGVPAVRKATPLLLAGVALLGAAAVYQYPPPAIDPIGNVRAFGKEVDMFLSPSQREQAVEDRREYLRSQYLLPSEVLAAVEGRTVSVDPWEIAVAWAYGLDWSPLPVFQNYSAYTSELDSLNADEVSSPEGPETILQQDTSTIPLDGRLSTWDPPQQALATMCNFFPAVTRPGWQALVRVRDRCGEPVPAGTVSGRFGESVDVPAPGRDEVVYVSIDGAGVHGLEKLRGIVYRPKNRFATFADGATYRLVPDTAGDGLILRAGKGVTGVGAPFSPVPQTVTLELGGANGDLEFEFFRMKVSAPGRGASFGRMSEQEALSPAG
jgi:hypothetical protein